jgi:VanZ family protein
MRSFSKYWLPVLIWLGLIFIGSTDMLSAEYTSRFFVPFLRWLDPHISWEAINTIHTAIRKLGHVTEYAILAVLLWRAVGDGLSFKAKTPIVFVAVWLACGIFAVSDEFHQSLVPSRTPSVRDVIVDICGAFIGLVICSLFTERKSSRAFATASDSSEPRHPDI